MTFRVRYTPFNFDAGRKGLFDFYARINYRMFPEMAEEFDQREFEKYKEIDLQMQGKQDENDNWYYELDIELPYGEIKSTFKQ